MAPLPTARALVESQVAAGKLDANEARHTPGPWLWGLDDVDAVWAPNGGEGNVICCPPPERAADSYARWPANARLIAAAPEMYAALSKMLTAYAAASGGDYAARNWLEAAVEEVSAALAKAREQGQ